jgi:hypothetical protein
MDGRALISPLYKAYYSDSYQTFRPTMKESVLRNILLFRDALFKSPLNQPNCELIDLSLDEIKIISDMANNAIDPLIEPLIDSACEKLRVCLIGQKNISLSHDILIEQFRHMNKIYYTVSFYSALLAFDGVIDALGEHFHKNFEKYTIEIGFKR